MLIYFLCTCITTMLPLKDEFNRSKCLIVSKFCIYIVSFQGPHKIFVTLQKKLPCTYCLLTPLPVFTFCVHNNSWKRFNSAPHDDGVPVNCSDYPVAGFWTSYSVLPHFERYMPTNNNDPECMVSHWTGIEVGSWSVISLKPMQAFPSIFCLKQKTRVQGYSIILPINQDISCLITDQ